MQCNVEGKGCRVCPAMWLAAVLLLVSLVQSFFFSAAPAAKSTDRAPAAGVAQPTTP